MLQCKWASCLSPRPDRRRNITGCFFFTLVCSKDGVKLIFKISMVEIYYHPSADTLKQCLRTYDPY